MSNEENTLILRFSSIGDVVMTIPVLRCLEKKYPDKKFIFVTRKKFAPFFKEFNNITFFEVDFKKRHKGLLGLCRLFKDLKNTNPTKIADLHNVLRTQFLKFLFQLSFHKVVSVDKKRIERKALTRKKNKIFKPLTSIHFNYQEVFNKLGFDIDLTKDHSFPASKNFSLNTEAISLTNRRIIGIAPFARYLTKTYPLDLMQKVVGFLDQKYTVFLFGFGKFEMDIIEKWSKVFKNVYSSSSLGGFENEIALISNLDLMISMDSANGHIASIYNVPVITLWGLTHPYTGFTTFNTSPDNQLCVDREKYPFVPNSIYGNKELKGYEDAMRSINYNDVLARAESILNNRLQK